MKLWTMVMSVVVAFAVASSAFAQDAPKDGGKKRGGPRFNISFKDIDANSDGKLTKDEYKTAFLKNVPEDKKEKAKEFVDRACDRLFGDKTELTEEEFKAAREKMMKDMKGKRGGKRGGQGGEKKKDA